MHFFISQQLCLEPGSGRSPAQAVRGNGISVITSLQKHSALRVFRSPQVLEIFVHRYTIRAWKTKTCASLRNHCYFECFLEWVVQKQVSMKKLLWNLNVSWCRYLKQASIKPLRTIDRVEKQRAELAFRIRVRVSLIFVADGKTWFKHQASQGVKSFLGVRHGQPERGCQSHGPWSGRTKHLQAHSNSIVVSSSSKNSWQVQPRPEHQERQKDYPQEAVIVSVFSMLQEFSAKERFQYCIWFAVFVVVSTGRKFYPKTNVPMATEDHPSNFRSLRSTWTWARTFLKRSAERLGKSFVCKSLASWRWSLSTCFSGVGCAETVQDSECFESLWRSALQRCDFIISYTCMTKPGTQTNWKSWLA